MSLRHGWYIVPLAVAAVLAFSAAFTGCGKGAGDDSAAKREAEEREFLAQMKEKHAARGKVAGARYKAVQEMEAIVEKARAALKEAGAAEITDDLLKVEIESHPERYPRWKELYAEVERLNAEYSAKSREAQEAMRARILKEGRAIPGGPDPAGKK